MATSRIVARALDLRGDARRAYLRACAGEEADGSGFDEARYDELIRLVHWSELDPLAHTEAPPDRVLDAEDARLAAAWAEEHASLEGQGPPAAGIEPGATIARGGMGHVQEAWDPLLRRTVAIKTVRGDLLRFSQAVGAPPHAALLRLLEEARITGNLDHPGIVPVHALGLDGAGRAYFSMRRVQGEELGEIFGRVQDGTGDWTRTRCLGVLNRVCEAMAYAHSRGIVHRDLKPANVMVGRFGEVHVMDWGVARALDSSVPPETQSEADPDRTADDPLRTREGDVLGTPAYMPPEQAAGRLRDVGPRSDVYSVGAMLYHLLSGRPPYTADGVPPEALVPRILHGAPRPLLELAPSAPPELVAITERAMARLPGERYADMGEMAADLSAFLEDRVVRAHRVGAVVELQKWIQRNRLAASALAAALLATFLGLSAVGWSERARAREQQRELDFLAASSLLREADSLGVADRDGSRHARWLARVEDLDRRAPRYVRELEGLRREGRPERPTRSGAYPAVNARVLTLTYLLDARARLVADLEVERSASAPERTDEITRDLERLAQDSRQLQLEQEDLQHRLQLLAAFAFDDPEDQARHDALARFLDEHYTLASARRARVDRVRAQATALGRLRTDPDPDALERWRTALASIHDPERSPAYDGLPRLDPEALLARGLVPLRQDPDSGLWEFWHCLSGAEPRPAAGGGWDVQAQTGLVLVLLPGGGVTIGDSSDAREPLVGCVRVHLDPFLVSKYELTQEQWSRLEGANPSYYAGARHFKGVGLIGPAHPVEQVSWEDCARALPRWGLDLPTEAQWEYAARGGEFASLLSADAATVNLFSTRDPHRIHAPVGSFPPNRFGLHDVLGNVYEWCRNWNEGRLGQVPLSPGDGMPQGGYAERRAVRGFSFQHALSTVRIEERDTQVPNLRQYDVGVRPILPLYASR